MMYNLTNYQASQVRRTALISSTSRYYLHRASERSRRISYAISFAMGRVTRRLVNPIGTWFENREASHPRIFMQIWLVLVAVVCAVFVVFMATVARDIWVLPEDPLVDNQVKVAGTLLCGVLVVGFGFFVACALVSLRRIRREVKQGIINHTSLL